MKSAVFHRGLLFSLALTIATVLPAHADEWSKTYNLSGKPDLRIDTSDANIRVTTWDQNTIEARVTTRKYKIGDGGIQIEEHQNGDTVELEPMSAFDRRVVHQAIKDDPDVETHSVEVEGTDKKAILLRPRH